MILLFDVETTGLPDDRLPLHHPSQPRLVQLACLLLERDGTERASFCTVVNPGRPIPAAASAIHGIDDALADKAGVPERAAVTMWHYLASRADTLVAHHIAFDYQLMQMAWVRGELPPTCHSRHGGRRHYCTMEAAAPIIDLPPTARMLRAGFDKPKAPKLAECMEFFFGEQHANAHDAMADVRACARVFFHMQALAAIAPRQRAAPG